MKNKNEIIEKWLNAIDLSLEQKTTKCPKCEVGNILSQYVGDEKSRVGYLAIWCDSCNKGLHFSRVKIPDNIDMLSFDDNVADVIPNFEQIKPY